MFRARPQPAAPVRAAKIIVYVLPTGQTHMTKEHFAQVVWPLLRPLDAAKAEKVAAEVQMAANKKVSARVVLQLQKVDADDFKYMLQGQQEWGEGLALRKIVAAGDELALSFLAEVLEVLSDVDMSRDNDVHSTVGQLPLSVFVDVSDDGKKSWVLLLAARPTAMALNYDGSGGGGDDVFATPHPLQSRQPAATTPSSTALTSIKSEARNVFIVQRGNPVSCWCVHVRTCARWRGDQHKCGGATRSSTHTDAPPHPP